MEKRKEIEKIDEGREKKEDKEKKKTNYEERK